MAAGWASTTFAKVANGAMISRVQLSARLGIGDLRPLEALNDRAGVPVLADLLAAAEAGEYRQHSGGIRTALIERLVRIEGGAEALGDEIERRSESEAEFNGTAANNASEETTGGGREDLFGALAAQNTPAAMTQLGRFLFDGRNGYVREAGGRVSNAVLAGRGIVQALGPDSPVQLEAKGFGLEELARVQEWWRAHGVKVEREMQPAQKGDQSAQTPRRLDFRSEHVTVKEVTADRNYGQNFKEPPTLGLEPATGGPVGWLVMAAGLFGTAAALPIVFRRGTRLIR